MNDLDRTITTKNRCQIADLQSFSESLKLRDVFWQKVRKLFRHSLKKRAKSLFNLRLEPNKIKTDPESLSKNTEFDSLYPGDLVLVRSKDEIRKTLNHLNFMKGCGFMEEMWNYCGTEQRIFKRVEQFLDERDYLIKKCKGIVTLEEVICDGVKTLGRCDRCCFYFWREEWLKKIE